MATHLSPEEQAEGFTPLFNGKDLNDWKIIGPEEGWEVQNGLMVCNGEGRGWIRPKAMYTDFVLRLDYRNSAGGNSGIFLRTSEEGTPRLSGNGNTNLRRYHTTRLTINQMARSTTRSRPLLIRLTRRGNGTRLKCHAREQW